MKGAESVPVDFSNADEDGAVRLVTSGTIEYLSAQDIELFDGRVLLMTDGELLAEGECALRDGMWVARITRWVT